MILTKTLRFLASGESQQSLSFSYRIGKSTVSQIVRERCDAIDDVLSPPTYLQPPASQEHWLAISKQFEFQWNLPHVIGALDGKHIRIQCPQEQELYFTIIMDLLAWSFLHLVIMILVIMTVAFLPKASSTAFQAVFFLVI